MKMNDLLFESKGANKKRSKVLKSCGGIIISCGVIFLMIGIIAPSCVNYDTTLVFTGIIAVLLGVGIMRMPSHDYTKDAYLRVYSDHVEGKQIAPKEQFSLKYTEIFYVSRMEVFANEFLVIKSGKKQYSVLVDDVNTAYEIINEKLDELERI